MALFDNSLLRPQLKFWSLHVTITAMPSFCLALMMFNTPTAIIAMLAGVATFVIGYTLLTSTTLYKRVSGASLLGQAVKKGTKIRMWISVGTSPLLAFAIIGGGQVLLVLCPDYWAGFAAVMGVNWIADNVVGMSGGWEGMTESFFFTYFVVIAEGLIISFTLLLLVFFSLLFLSRKAARGGMERG